jgi:hypothetical protein
MEEPEIEKFEGDMVNTEETREKELERENLTLKERIQQLEEELKAKDQVRMDSHAEKPDRHSVKTTTRGSGHSIFWGLVLMTIGFIWMGRNLDWFRQDIPWMSLIMIAIGLYLVLRYWDQSRKGRSRSETKS